MLTSVVRVQSSSSLLCNHVGLFPRRFATIQRTSVAAAAIIIKMTQKLNKGELEWISKQEFYSMNSFLGYEGAQAIAEALPTAKPTFVSLRIRDTKMGEKGAQCLANSLRTNRQLTHLWLYDEDIGTEGAKALGACIKDNRTITTLQLENLKIPEDALPLMLAGLKANSTITDLSFKYTKLTGGARHLVEALKDNRTLTSLSLFSCGIREAGAEAIANLLKQNSSILTLDLYSNEFEAAGGVALGNALAVNKTVTNVNMDRNLIREEGTLAFAAALKSPTSALRLLNLESTYGRERGLAAVYSALETNTVLTDLNLYDLKGTGDNGLAKMLTANNTLTRLNLSTGNSTLGEAEGKLLGAALQENTTLTWLGLRGHRLMDVGAIAIARALQMNKSLTFLNLGDNTIKNDGFAALASMLKENSTLTYLGLPNNRPGLDGCTELSEALTVNTALLKLDVSSCLWHLEKLLDQAFMKFVDALKVNRGLTEFSVDGGRQSKESYAAAVAMLKENNRSLLDISIPSAPSDVQYYGRLNGCLRLCEWKVVLRQLRMPPPILNLIHDYDKTAPHPIEDWECENNARGYARNAEESKLLKSCTD